MDQGLPMLAPPNHRERPHPPGLMEALSLPLAVAACLRFTPEAFAELCAANPEAVLELAADGSLIPVTPTGSETGAQSGALFFQIKGWANTAGPWKAFDSSTGFRLPDGSVVSPDAALVSLERWQSLTAEQRRGFAPLCPDLVVELASPSEEGPRGLTALRQKMAAYQRNGACLGWLLIPAERAVEVWGPNESAPTRVDRAESLDAESPFPGLTIQLDAIWAG